MDGFVVEVKQRALQVEDMDLEESDASPPSPRRSLRNNGAWALSCFWPGRHEGIETKYGPF
ncbi:hypothetical protein DPMN_074664 [Dreissena polymorpha]|uniref:Uncharacterized protein n=1 Tax=Dreissena polymorpha TaxID=45954 RepID=A0A9D3YFP7_DREPO|nr:hypothetical protein DPMN_074664 [Dreissena polymorpha]